MDCVFLVFYAVCAWFGEDLVMSVDVLNEPCTVSFAVIGVRVGMIFCVLHSVRVVLLRFGDVSGCAERAVHSVICCCWYEGRIGFSWCSTQCARGFVTVW